ncbi:GIP [Symbiodinium sp. CCMP2456]|nr:GIP [Symbiodinium sp. CCMP2456]
MSEKDPFKDLTFSGAPSEYRLFRRKILLSVASLEEKHLYLAGPRILNRLQGEAWRATEHLSIGELRTEQGWLKVLRALDDHYRYLPETELNECVDECLFHLKRRGNEGPTAFVSRFKAVLSRPETLVAAECAQQKGSTKRRRPTDKHADSEAEQQSSSLSSDHAADDDGDDEPRLTRDRVDQAAAASDPAATAKTVGSFIDSVKGKKKTPASGGGSHRSRGTHRADEERANRRMLEDLGKLEVGHLRVKPIFFEVILGHLFMRKYGLTREQRSQVIRSTGGSCKFKDVEKVIRASDYEDKMNEPGTRHAPPRQGRSTHVLAAEEGSSLSEPTYSDDEEVHEAAESFDEEGDEELEEAYEVQKQAKHEAKRAYRSYRDQERKAAPHASGRLAAQRVSSE